MERNSMNQSDDECTNPTLEYEINETVCKIFDGIFDGPMDEFKKPLQVIEENQFGLLWREENELEEKVTSVAEAFLDEISINLSSKHAEAAKHIEGSTCELFLQYAHRKLDESLLGQEPFKNSCAKIKQLIKKKTSQIKATLEINHDDQPVQESSLKVMILVTDLLDSIHVRHALLCCRAANECEVPESWENSLKDLEEEGEEHLLTSFCVSYENEHVPKYVMARCGNVLYVSFKEVQSYKLGMTEKSFRGEIYKGVSETARTIPLKFFVQEIIEKNNRIIFSGHSTGGAVAALVLVFLLEKFLDHGKEFVEGHFKCITFGMIPLGDTAFKKFVEAMPGARECFCHIVGTNDVIPKLFGSLNSDKLRSLLREILEEVLKKTPISSTSLSGVLKDKMWPDFLKECSSLTKYVVGFDYFDIFGTYFILHTSSQGQKYSKQTSEQAAKHLKIKNLESLRTIGCQILTNHKLKRYSHEVRLAFPQKPDLKKFNNGRNMTIMNDVKPNINHVQVENIGKKGTAKIHGTGLWFVYNVSIEAANCERRDLTVDVTKSLESELQTTVQEKHLDFPTEVSARVKTHFHNSEYLPLQPEITVKTATHDVTGRQEQLAKRSPSQVIELAYLGVLLERHQGSESERFKDVKTVLENAVTTVPLESLFDAFTTADLNVMLQCCELFCSNNEVSKKNLTSKYFLASIERALSRIATLKNFLAKQNVDDEEDSFEEDDDENSFEGDDDENSFEEDDDENSFEEDDDEDSVEEDDDESSTEEDDFDDLGYQLSCLFGKKAAKQFASEVKQKSTTELNKNYELLDKTYHKILSKKRSVTGSCQDSLCKFNLKAIYPSRDVKDKRGGKAKCFKSPTTLLEESRNELNQLSKKLNDEQLLSAEECTSSNTNEHMLSALANMREEFKLCCTLLNAFMECEVQMPLEKAKGDGYVNRVAKHAKSFGLSVWELFSLPFAVLNKLLGGAPEGCKQLVIKFSQKIDAVFNSIFPPPVHQFPKYEERLRFLVKSIKKSDTCTETYGSYSLERLLQDECKKRHINRNTSVDDILNQWNDNFANGRLMLIRNDYRRLVARWIKWSLMINNLRESLAKQTAVGVIGLSNSGKSKFVRSLFGIEAITGTTDQKRTTVPLIYNVGQNIKGMDVIDFPGVDDRDESIPELAELLLSLTQIIIFVVDYRRAHSKSTKQWLSILDKENVPVLICLTFADKLFAELMGEDGKYEIGKVEAGMEKQLNKIKEKIGESERRDFKLTVFSFDNDSSLKTDEYKADLRKAGLNDELDVGRWIAGKLRNDDQNDLFENFNKFMNGKEKSTLTPCWRNQDRVLQAEETIWQPPIAKKQRLDEEPASSSGEEQATCSKNNKPM